MMDIQRPDAFFTFMCIFVICSFSNIEASDSDVLFVVLSQSDKYHASKAVDLREDIIKQFSSMNKGTPDISLVNEEFPHVGAWTVIPVMPWLVDMYGSNTLWVIFLEESTRVNVSQLITTLEQYDPEESIWLGHALFDEESTIIHHFAFTDNPTEFKYPLFASGFVMTMDLLESLVNRNEDKLPKSGFSIDASHELALYVGEPLLNLPDVFCLKEDKNCATYPVKITSCGERVNTEQIFFAVKTCLIYHEDRVPIVKKTWGKDTKHIEFFSHIQDKYIPTTDVGIDNTEQGHCVKTFTIFRLVLERSRHLPAVRWLVLADDDTLLSVSRLQEVLSCWNSSEPIAIGERYGYNVQDRQQSGYNYLTGGAGIAISIIALPSILQQCSCQNLDTPDDMYLGICLARLDIPMVHSSDFHQARPHDYASDYLAVQKPVSFHKHWMIDPVKVYGEWFGPGASTYSHTEL